MPTPPFSYYVGHPVAILGAGANVATVTTRDLSSVYSYGVSGACIGFRFIAPETTTITDFYVFCSAVTGAPTGNLICEVRAFSAANDRIPQALVVGTATTTGTLPTAATWARFTFGTPVNITKGTQYWVCVGASAGSGTDFVTLNRISIDGVLDFASTDVQQGTSTNGFSTNAAMGTQATAPQFVMKFGSGNVMGSTFTVNNVVYTNNQLERGLKFQLDSPETLYGLFWANPASSMSGVKIYEGTGAPGSAVILDENFSAGVVGAHVFQSPPTLKAKTTYRVVFKFGSNGQGPRQFQIQDYAHYADVQLCSYMGGQCVGTIDNGAGGWTDAVDLVPMMGLTIDDFLPPFRRMRNGMEAIVQ